MILDWRLQRDKGGDVTLEDEKVSYAWDEVWNVIGYAPSAVPAWVDLLTDRPDLAPGQLHYSILSAYVTKFSPKPHGTADAWEVTVSYRIGDPREFDLPPTQRAAVIEVNPESVEVATTRQADDTPWINTAGDLFAGLTRVENHWSFSIRKNVESVPAWALTYADAVNSDTVVIRGLSVAAHYLLLKELRIGNLDKERVNAIDYLFYPVDFTLVYNPRTWMTKVLNRGLYQIDAGGKYTRCKDEKGKDADEPQFLDINGKQLPFPVNPASIITVDGWDHELKPFADLPLS